MRLYPVIGIEADGGTFADGSLAARIKELVLSMESTALAYGMTRVKKPYVAVKSCPCHDGVHLHAGFYAAPIESEPS